ncbi:autotransporter domain-containing protein [Sphingopyxis sp.]|uniref:autotransporter domain-containing protein n=1 Tax=Sphingopyxis sp. TaxID=1908224 RepID=UPI003D0C86C4
MTKPFSCPRQHRAALLGATAIAALSLAAPAAAQCVVQPGGAATCSGDNGAEQTVINGGGAVTVTTTPGFRIDSPGNGLVISGSGSLIYNDDNASTIIGRGRDGIAVGNGGGASRVEIRTAGDVTGGGRAGIIVNNAGTGGVLVEAGGTVTGALTGITVVALTGSGGDSEVISNNAAGGTSGIGVENRGGTGAIRITSTGTASATNSEGFAILGFHSVQGAGGDLVIEANHVGGAGGGIQVNNMGRGSTSVTVNGTLDVASRQGLTIGNFATATDLTVTARSSVTSGATAIAISNVGTGLTVITAQGQLLSNNVRPQESDISGNGMNITTGGSAGDVIANVAGVEGRAGILIRNLGRGSLALTATGLVEGRDGRGVEIVAGSSAGAIDVDLAAVTGATDGVTIAAQGNSPVNLSIAGPVIANGNGVRVEHSANGIGDLNVTVGSVSGGQNGVLMLATGSGNARLVATGTLSGEGGAGLNMFSRGEIEADVVDVTGVNGVLISTSGPGSSIDFVSTGTLTGTGGDGAFFSNAGTIRIDATDSVGTRNGLTLSYGGPDEARILLQGTATGGASGVRAATAAGTTGTLAMDVNNASGGDYGVSIQTRDAGGATLITRGLVEGGIAGVDYLADNGGAFLLTNLGTIRNSSAASADLAIQSAGGAVEIVNNGSLLGTVRLDAGVVVPEPEPEDPPEEQRELGARSAFVIAEVPDIAASHRFTNAGTWNSIGGVNVFGGDDDVLANIVGGRLIGGVSAATAETTTYSGLETLVNGGTITMVDGGFGDVVQTSGDASFAAGSVLAVDAGGSGSDRFLADGATTIEAGARLQVSNPQPLVLGTRYTVLESAGGVVGSFTLDNALQSAFLGYRQGSTPTTIFVELARLRAFAAAGLTPNQTAVGSALDGQAGSDPLAAAAMLLSTDAAAQAAFDGLSGEVHPAVRTAMVEDTRLPRNAVLERLRAPQGGAVWAQLVGNWGESDGKGGTADLDRDMIGGVLGADFGVGDGVVIGAAGAYLETDLTLAARASDAKLKSFHILGYAGVGFGDLSLKAGVGYASYDIDTDRFTAFPGVGQTLLGAYDGSVIHGFAEAGYRIGLGGGHVEPFAQVVAIRAKTDGFAETGGSAALAGVKAKENALASTLGIRFETAPAGTFSVAGMAGWQHGFGTLEPVSQLRFGTGPAFSILAAGQSRNAGAAAIEGRFRPSERITVSVGYDGVIGSAGQDHSIKAGLRIAF